MLAAGCWLNGVALRVSRQGAKNAKGESPDFFV